MVSVEDGVDFDAVRFVAEVVFAARREIELGVEGAPAWCVGCAGGECCWGCESGASEEGKNGEGDGGEMHDGCCVF